jgi:arylsulfatase A-like enzyme
MLNLPSACPARSRVPQRVAAAQAWCALFFKVALWIGCLVGLTSSLWAQAEPTAPPRRNVVFILADDLGWAETGPYGQQKIPTPHIDRLAAQGMRFTQHYSGAPVCAPSRCVLLTGKHSGHAEIRGNQQAKKLFPEFEEGQHPLSEQALTLPQHFRQHGYATAAMGKWGLGPVGSTGDPNAKGLDLFVGYNCQAVAHSYYPPFLWRNHEQIALNPRPVKGHAPAVTGDVGYADRLGAVYAPQRLVEEAVTFIEQQAERPFFLYFPCIEPHVAMHPPREEVERFPADWDPTPYRGQCGYLAHPRPRAAYAAMVARVDAYVGRLLDALERTGTADRTLVIFTSDNGTTHPHNGDPVFHVGGVDARFFNSTADLRGYKGSLYEGGIRVPAIARLPGVIPAGAVSDQPGYFPDWFPTLCEAAGLPVPEGLDGRSLWPVLTGQEQRVERAPMVWVFPEYGGQVAVRWQDWKLVRQKLKTKRPGPWELYRLDTDHSEEHDLAAEHPTEVAHGLEILRDQMLPNAIFPVPVPGVNVPEPDNDSETK